MAKCKIKREKEIMQPEERDFSGKGMRLLYKHLMGYTWIIVTAMDDIAAGQEYWEKDGLVNDVLQQLVIDLGGEESSDSEIESEEEDSLDHDIVPIIYSENEF
ncbi:unnamed protein product [Parnassius apollo]|uniref:(apollo) hypothetical protein n=1 Tax=Parnassius apollo TaxID=110799 RepID=A0A8S3X4Z0_PARAO|nr:unnamed protein product [Parnassius apollo]